MKKIFNQLFVLMGLGLSLSACHKSELVSVSKAVVHTANGITSENLQGTIKGTLLAGKTYYVKGDITINEGDTLLMQSGVNLIIVGDGVSAASSPEIFCHGTFISLGTKDAPNYITVQNAADLHNQANQQKYDQPFFGWWGGITCTPTPGGVGGDLILKWTHVEFAGANAGPNDDQAIYKGIVARFNIYYNNVNKNVILEDSWFFGAKDDNIQIGAAHISIMRNTFEMCGAVGGEFFNIKTGSVGDIAYNVFIGSATNAMKISDSGNSGTTPQCTAAVYNNTIIDGGFRQTKAGRGGSIDFEKGAKGFAYNNLIINCRFGLRITADADVTHVQYGNNGYYASTQGILDQFYANDSAPSVLAAKAASDVRSTTVKANSPSFYLFNVDQYDFTANPGPIDYKNQTPASVMIGSSSFRLQPNSPFVGKGRTDFSPMRTVTATGTYGTDITLPGKDLGAYQTDGTGNQH